MDIQSIAFPIALLYIFAIICIIGLSLYALTLIIKALKIDIKNNS